MEVGEGSRPAKRQHRRHREVCSFALTNEGSPPPQAKQAGGWRAHSVCADYNDGGSHSEPLQRQLTRALKSVSRLKLRAFISALSAAATAEGVLQVKELYRLSAEHQMLLSEQQLDHLAESCIAHVIIDHNDTDATDMTDEGQNGTKPTGSYWIDSDATVFSLVNAHANTRRESVELFNSATAEGQPDDQASGGAAMTELTRRVVEQLTLHRRFVDLDNVRKDLRKRDTSRSGLLPKRAIMDVCARHDNPVYGSVLAAVLKRFKDSSTGTVRWQKFVKFLQQAQQVYFEANPSAPRQQSAKTVSATINSSAQSLSGASSAASSATWSTVTLASTDSAEEAIEIDSKSSLTLASIGESKLQPKKKSVMFNGSRTSLTVVAAAKATHAELNREADKTGKNHLLTPQQQSAALLTPSPVPALPAVPTRQFRISCRFGDRLVTCPDSFNWTEASTKEAQSEPIDRLELDWVYGYRGNDCRKNLISLASSGELVYPIGRLVVLLSCSPDGGTVRQRHYREHADDVRSLSLHPDGQTIASGGSAIRVWNSATLATVAELNSNQSTSDMTSSSLPAIVCLAFLDSDRLISVDDGAPQPLLKLWCLSTRACLANVRPSAAVVCDIAVSPAAGRLAQFVTVGRGHIAWWRHRDRERLELVREGDATILSARYIVSAVYSAGSDGRLVTGDSSGGVAVWKDPGENEDLGDGHVQQLWQQLHQGPVFTLLELSFSRFCWMLSGGRDGRLAVWRVSDVPLLSSTERADPSTQEPAVSCVALPEEAAGSAGIRSICVFANTVGSGDSDTQPDEDDGGVSLALGTTNNAIFLCRLPAPGAEESVSVASNEAEEATENPLAKAQLRPDPLTAGHYDRLRSLSGLASHPSVFVTAGYDSQVRMYNAESRRCLHTAVLPKKCISSVLWHSSGTLIFGTRTGQLIILQRSGGVLCQMFKRRVARHKITAIASAHSGETIAIGDARGRIYFVQQRRHQKRHQTDQKPESPTPQISTDQLPGVQQSSTSAIEHRDSSWLVVGEIRVLRHAVEAIDFASDRFEGSLLLRASNRVAELAFCDATNFHLSTDEERFRNVTWSTHSCLCCYYSVGVWNSELAATRSITAMDACPSRSLLAVGLETGQVLLYRMPCLSPKATYREFQGPGKISGLKFLSEGSRLVAVGGSEACTMQWNVL